MTKLVAVGLAILALIIKNGVDKLKAETDNEESDEKNKSDMLLRAHSGYESIANSVEYMQKANEETILMVQIESTVGVDNVGEILDVEGIDVAFVGPSDLSQSMGIMGQLEQPIFVEALDKISAAAKARNKAAGIHCMYPKTNLLKGWVEKGLTFNLWSNDVEMLMNSGRENLAKINSSLLEI